MQWRYKCVDGPADAEGDLWMLDQLARRLMKLYAEEGGPNAESITKLAWDYGQPHPDVRAVAKEINGYDLTTGKLMDSFGGLKNDGTTLSGNWLYCNSYVEPEKEPDAPIPGNRASRRSLDDSPFNIGLYSKFAWWWPVNRRIIYNRASVDLDGQKLWWFMVIVFGVVLLITGATMASGTAVPAALLQWMVFIHDMAFIATGCMLLVHVYLSVAHPLMRPLRTGPWSSMMTRGRVSVEYANSHHGKWYERMAKAK
ncbi:cytochrome b/b6 domain-containing protein [Chloroflexota bacterium]